MRAWFTGLAAALVSASLLAPVATAQPDGMRIGSDLIVETIDRISSEDLWHLAVPQHVPSKSGNPPGGVIGLWNYGRENRRTDGDWFAVCILMDGFGDIAERPVAMRVWSRSPANASVIERPPGVGLAVAFEVAVGQSKFTVSHTPMGEVRLNDQKIGQIQ